MDLTIARPLVGSIAVISGTVAIAGHYAWPRRKWFFLVLKALTTCLILIVAVISALRGWSAYAGAILVGLVFALAGDVLLGLPRERFIAGLGSFMAGNLIYSFGFAASSRLTGVPWPALPVILFGAWMLWYLWPSLRASLRLPVSAYVLVMVTMACSALSRAVGSPGALTVCAALGALLFMISDAVLAVSRFRHPFHMARGIVLGSYFLGQLLIALSVGG